MAHIFVRFETKVECVDRFKQNPPIADSIKYAHQYLNCFVCRDKPMDGTLDISRSFESLGKNLNLLFEDKGDI
jgi:hypothetical protein